MENKIKDEYFKRSIKLLDNYTNSQVYIMNLKEEIDIIKHEDISISSCAPKDVVVFTNDIHSSTENISIERDMAIKRLTTKLRREKKIVDTIENSINSLPRNQREVILLKYIKHLSWVEISFDTHYSERWCKTLRNKAVRSIAYALFGDIIF